MPELFPIENETKAIDQVKDYEAQLRADLGVPNATDLVGNPPPVNTPATPQMPEAESAGFGPQVPDTTTPPAAADSPGALFTTENMGADTTSDFLKQYSDMAPKPEAGGMETVQGQLSKILNEPNPLFDWAKGQASQYANSRGLANSDIAAEASSQAVMQTALPIAQKDAETFARALEQERQFYHTAGLQAFDATIQSGLMAQQSMQTMVEMSHQGDINSRLQLEQYGYNWQLNEQQNLHNMQLAALQGSIQAELALQQFGFNAELMRQDYGYRLKLQDIELRNALRIGDQQQDNALEQIAATHANTLTQIEANSAARINEIAASGDVARQQDEERFAMSLQQNYLSAVENRTLQFSAEVQSIYSTQGLTAAQQANAVNVARDNYVDQLNLIADQYAKSSYWDSSWEVSPSPTPGNTGGGGGGSGGGPLVNTPPDSTDTFGDHNVPPGPSIPDYSPGDVSLGEIVNIFGPMPNKFLKKTQWQQRVDAWLRENYGFGYQEWESGGGGGGGTPAPNPNTPAPGEPLFPNAEPIMTSERR